MSGRSSQPSRTTAPGATWRAAAGPKPGRAYSQRTAHSAGVIASYAMPALIAPSPITAIALPGRPLSRFATANPSAAEIEVDECAAPNGSYSLSERLVNPDSPPPCRNVRIRSRRPVRTLCG